MLLHNCNGCAYPEKAFSSLFPYLPVLTFFLPPPLMMFQEMPFKVTMGVSGTALEMEHWLRMFVGLAEDQSLLPITHIE